MYNFDTLARWRDFFETGSRPPCISTIDVDLSRRLPAHGREDSIPRSSAQLAAHNGHSHEAIRENKGAGVFNFTERQIRRSERRPSGALEEHETSDFQRGIPGQSGGCHRLRF